MDYFIVAGTPEWMYRNEDIYKYCLKHDIPISLIGVGTKNIFTSSHRKLMTKLSRSNLCEIALCRDKPAYDIFSEYKFANIEIILDPAFFMPPVVRQTADLVNIVNWQKIYFGKKHPNLMYDYPLIYLKNRLMFTASESSLKRIKNNYDKYMQKIFAALPGPKLVVVHENHEVEEANRLFGKEHVFFSTDYNLILDKYACANFVYSSRIHGAIPALVHGAPIHLIYPSPKAKVLESTKKIFENYNFDQIAGLLKIDYLKSMDLNKDILIDLTGRPEKQIQAGFSRIIEMEKVRTKQLLRKTKILSHYLK
jgi:hypothetical protein